MLNRIDGIIILVLFVVVSLTGCDRYEEVDMGVVVPPPESEGYEAKEVDMRIEAVGILSISEERPAEVLIGAIGSHFNTCVNMDAKIYYEREGNTIRLWASKQILDGAVCGQAVTEAYGEVSVGNLEVGEYQIVSDSRELHQFRIEEDTGYVTRRPIIHFVDFAVKLSDPALVTMSVRGYFGRGCEPFLKTDVTRTEGTINIDISGEVPLNADCQINPFRIYVNDSYSAEIDLGKFSLGRYKVIVNGKERWFDI